MKFTEAEVKFLLKSHRIENAAGQARELRASTNLSELGCPRSVFDRVLEDRARRLGGKFAEFRAMSMARPAPADDLDARVQGSSLF